MKKTLSLLLVLILAFTLLAGCGASSGPKKIVVGATPVPHAEILAVAKEILKEKGYELEIKEFTDYIQPNLSLQSKDLDANFFQHTPYLNDFNAEQKTDLVPIASIHYEPLGVYPGKTKSLDGLKDGAQVAIPNDTTNEARALLLLETQGLIKLDPNAGFKATPKDIVENPKNLKFVEIEAAQLVRSLQDVDIAVINGNYAIQGGLNAMTDALAREEKDSAAATTYANILVVRRGDENREDLKALAEALRSEEVKKFIEEKYEGAVVPMF
ncbi:MAG: ABC transporter substrate-binding protein [Clostridiaceae bacterium]|nr:ABC transporter substrate-binding protein [Clostridiaceae bacterium]